MGYLNICRNELRPIDFYSLMYFEKQLDFHLPSFLIFSSEIPSKWAWVAAPIRKECDLNVAVSICRNVRALLSTDENWYAFRGEPFQWVNRSFEETVCLCFKYANMYWKRKVLRTDFEMTKVHPLPNWSVLEYLMVTCISFWDIVISLILSTLVWSDFDLTANSPTLSPREGPGG